VHLATLRRQSRAIPGYDIINRAVGELVLDLRANNAQQPGPGQDYALEYTRDLLWQLIDYAEQFLINEYRQLVNKRQFTFGSWPLAPTQMGNVAKTIQSYAVKRYDFNFEFFWTRMQLALQKDKEFGPVLESAKTQLDFLVSCSFLTFLWSVFWGTCLFLTAGPVWLFLAVTLGGPVLAWVWYRVALVHYRTFADVLRTSVDLFRLDLLAQLHYPRPDGVKEERELWETVDALHSLYELRDIRYVHPKT
jgi:hypothetical protein